MPTVNVNGYDLHYEDNDFTDPWRPSEVVFLNHYGYGNLRLYYKWIPILAREYRVVRMDRRGFGRSQAPPFGYQLTVEDMLSDWLGFLDALGISRVHFVGDRFGGSVGAAFAATYPERVRSLVMIASPMHTQRVKHIFGPGAETVLEEGSWLDANKTWARRPEGLEGGFEERLKALYGREQMAMIPPHMLSAFRRLSVKPEFTIEPVLARIKAPTLLLSPDAAEPLLTNEEQAYMRDTIPDCEQVIFPGANHDIAYWQDERCAELTLDFIRKHSGS
jgi:3-oxoadipate enol-lactonase